MKLSDGPEVFDGISLPRPRKPVVTVGSPSSASVFAPFETVISASSIQGVLIGFSIHVVIEGLFGICSSLFDLSTICQVQRHHARNTTSGQGGNCRWNRSNTDRRRPPERKSTVSRVRRVDLRRLRTSESNSSRDRRQASGRSLDRLPDHVPGQDARRLTRNGLPLLLITMVGQRSRRARNEGRSESTRRNSSRCRRVVLILRVVLRDVVRVLHLRFHEGARRFLDRLLTNVPSDLRHLSVVTANFCRGDPSALLQNRSSGNVVLHFLVLTRHVSAVMVNGRTTRLVFIFSIFRSRSRPEFINEGTVNALHVFHRPGLAVN